MYEKLDMIIQECEYEDINTLNEWGDVVYKNALECIRKFSQEDWKMLYSELSKKSVIWKKRFVECMIDSNNPNQLKALMSIIDTTDDDLFSMVICQLIKFNISGFDNKDRIYNRVNNLYSYVGDYYKEMFNIFLENRGISRK